MAEFKYKEIHSQLTCDCPPSDSFGPCNMIAYRWVHENFEHENNFKPVLKINPTRIDEFESCEKKCQALGLSLFNDSQKAENKLKSFISRKPMLANILGNSIARGQINENDGVANQPDRTGHFTFHESKNSSIKSKFEFLKKCEF